jgi:hypothetical protein
VNRGIVGKNLTIDACLSNATGYELGVLRSEVKYYYNFMLKSVAQENLWTVFGVKGGTEIVAIILSDEANANRALALFRTGLKYQ